MRATTTGSAVVVGSIVLGVIGIMLAGLWEWWNPCYYTHDWAEAPGCPDDWDHNSDWKQVCTRRGCDAEW
jgi:hypothetical protein